MATVRFRIDIANWQNNEAPVEALRIPGAQLEAFLVNGTPRTAPSLEFPVDTTRVIPIVTWNYQGVPHPIQVLIRIDEAPKGWFSLDKLPMLTVMANVVIGIITAILAIVLGNFKYDLDQFNDLTNDHFAVCKTSGKKSTCLERQLIQLGGVEARARELEEENQILNGRKIDQDERIELLYLRVSRACDRSDPSNPRPMDCLASVLGNFRMLAEHAGCISTDKNFQKCIAEKLKPVAIKPAASNQSGEK